MLLEDPFVRRAMALFGELDVALVGIGGQEPSGLLASSGNVFSKAELRTVRAAGGVGDIGLRYLRRDGTPVDSPLDARVIGIALEQLKRVPRAIGVAGGPAKTPAIRAALLGGWINCLITDRFTAERLLRGRTGRRPGTSSPGEQRWHEGKRQSRSGHRRRCGGGLRRARPALRLHGGLDRGGGRASTSSSTP